MRMALATLTLAVLCGCGTVRYQVKQPTDGRKVTTEVQWDVAEIRFNNLWKQLITGGR